MAAKITKKPTVPVKGLKLAREKSGSRVMKGTWKVQSAMTSSKRKDRATGLRLWWYFDTDAAGKENIIDKDSTKKETATSDTENLSKFTANHGKKSADYTRESFYPHAGKPKLLSVTLEVDPYNGKGDGKRSGKDKVARSATYAFAKPRKPSISAPAFDTSSGTVSATVTTDAGEDRQERLWTRYEVIVTDLSKGGSQRKRTTSSGTSKATSFALSYDAANYQALTAAQYVKVEFRARAEGFAGDSEWASRTYYVSFPKPVSIPTSAKRRITVSSRDSSGKVVVPVAVSKPAGFPVDSVKLQKLVNVSYADASAIPGDAGWEDAGSTDDGDCTALVAAVGDLTPDAGKHTWVRVKAWHANEDALFSYSNVVEVPLFTPAASAADNACAITKAAPGEDGESIECVVAWDRKDLEGDEDTTGVELSWSGYDGAWKSTEEPSRFEFEWHDDVTDASAAESWNRSATVTIRGLDEGGVYHIRARCYTDDENGERGYGEYCDAASCQTSSTPPSVVLSAPPSVAEGEGVPFTWVLSSVARQASWQLVTPSGDVLAEGTGEEGAHVLAASRVAAFASGGSLECSVRCSTGGEFVESGPVTVNISERPELSVSAATLASQPFSFDVACSAPSFSLAYVVSASDSGITGCPETLRESQPAGDVVATGTVTPEAVAAEVDGKAVFKATVTLETGLDFYDGGTYRVSAVAADSSSGLASPEASAEFGVAWEHQAIDPEGCATVTPSVTQDDDGGVTRSCEITLEAPEGARSGDVFDLYRVTHDGADLIGYGLALNSAWVDEHAPFGDSDDYAYRVAFRTPDGDEEWADFAYELAGDVLRFDFGGGAVELPYGIEIADQYDKDAEVRTHMDGSAEAYFNAGVTRKASLSTDILRIEDAETAALVRALARHRGTAFVRTPDGSAYEAHVNVSSMDVGYGVINARFEAEQVRTSSAFMLPSGGAEASEEENVEG